MPSDPQIDPQILEWATRLRIAIGPLERQLRLETTQPFTATQFSMLETIKGYGPLSLTELAAREKYSAPTISKVVIILEESGLIERLADPSDRRISRVQLSEQGEKWFEEGGARRFAWLAGRISRLKATELAALVAALPVLEHLAYDEA
ncbi:MarR family winged helix-turn-helix transcriptional regulator [Streptomyces muensis]|uniref:MarR family transcriptional regulator n=1 Tax=Streptomyces muensis TaxID=1077944 RepID=A0A9X1PRS2_STRM4|nr:MarR family transcriptional regulator [Streptomyces muensis]MCF1592327.1 MarR family transcriptional regulator [Streptomyces muensis]